MGPIGRTGATGAAGPQGPPGPPGGGTGYDSGRILATGEFSPSYANVPIAAGSYIVTSTLHLEAAVTSPTVVTCWVVADYGTAAQSTVSQQSVTLQPSVSTLPEQVVPAGTPTSYDLALVGSVVATGTRFLSVTCGDTSGASFDPTAARIVAVPVSTLVVGYQ
jgi:hypothetical protein